VQFRDGPAAVSYLQSCTATPCPRTAIVAISAEIRSGFEPPLDLGLDLGRRRDEKVWNWGDSESEDLLGARRFVVLLDWDSRCSPSVRVVSFRDYPSFRHYPSFRDCPS